MAYQWVKDEKSANYIVTLGSPYGHFVEVRDLPTVAAEGDTITVEVDVQNTGNVSGIIGCKVIDVDAATQIAEDATWGNPVDPGVTVTFTLSFTMPNRDLTILFETGHWKQV